MASEGKISVLMVCLGNICRSPMAEAVFRHVAKENNLLEKFDKIDSAGTAAYHVGDDPDPRTLDVCALNDVDILHAGRKVEKEDFYNYHYILAMDGSNLRDLKRVRPADATDVKVMMFGDFSGGGKRGEVVEDPYYGGRNGFAEVFSQCKRFSQNFMKEVLEAEIK